MVFVINKNQEKKLQEWIAGKNLNLYGGAIGGRFTYSFTPTSLGVIIKVSDSMEQKDTLDLSDYEEW